MSACRVAAALVLFTPIVLIAQQNNDPLARYISVAVPVVALTHVEVIDGTGAASLADQTVVVDHGRIASVGAAAEAQIPAGAKVLDLHGRTVIPGLVGMHEHLFYTEPENEDLQEFIVGESAQTAPRLYLAGGVTTGRTTGSMEPYTDLQVKRNIDAGLEPGPDLDITGPYLDGPGTFSPQMVRLKDAADARQTVNYWADQGVTSFKAYMYVKPAALKAAIESAHARGIKVTGHLCSVSFTEAATMGIDNLEHGWVEDSDFTPGHKLGVCVSGRAGLDAFANKVDVHGPDAQAVIHTLVEHHVAVTSTLAIFESFAPNRPPLRFLEREHESMMPEAWASVLERRAAAAAGAGKSPWEAALKKEMAFERAFVAEGGVLMAGCDPTGYGAVLPGFGDDRNIELLAEAGFTPSEAIEIATLNGAKYLGRDKETGSIAVGKQADLVVVNGDLGKDVSAIEKVEMVFKKGVGYDPQKLIDSTRGMVGIR